MSVSLSITSAPHSSPPPELTEEIQALLQAGHIEPPTALLLTALPRYPNRQTVPVIELEPEIDAASGPFMDTAAIMRHLDLVITSDTSIAHLAGGLGVPVWLATSYAPDWRWMMQREDCLWYPTMRLFRQTKIHHWNDVFTCMAHELTKLASDL